MGPVELGASSWEPVAPKPSSLAVLEARGAAADARHTLCLLARGQPWQCNAALGATGGLSRCCCRSDRVAVLKHLSALPAPCLQNGPPDVPSMHELLLLSTRMGFDLLPSERFLAHFDQHQAGWPASQPQLQTQLAAAAAARGDAASRAPPAAIKGRCMAPAASTLREAAGGQRGPETPTSGEQVPSRVTLMQRQESGPAGAPSLHVYEVTRSSQRCCWQLSCEFTAAGAEARCY